MTTEKREGLERSRGERIQENDRSISVMQIYNHHHHHHTEELRCCEEIEEILQSAEKSERDAERREISHCLAR